MDKLNKTTTSSGFMKSIHYKLFCVVIHSKLAFLNRLVNPVRQNNFIILIYSYTKVSINKKSALLPTKRAFFISLNC